MSYYDRFAEGYEAKLLTTLKRRTALIEQIKQYIPLHPEAVARPIGLDEYGLRLKWVTVPDPRLEADGVIEVQPWLVLGNLEDGSGFKSEPGILSLYIVGKLPSGEESVVGTLDLTVEDEDLETDPGVFVAIKEDPTVVTEMPWESADAELFLSLLEAAMAAQSFPV